MQAVLAKKTSTAGKGTVMMHNKYGRHGDLFQMFFLYETQNKWINLIV